MQLLIKNDKPWLLLGLVAWSVLLVTCSNSKTGLEAVFEAHSQSATTVR